MKSSVTKTFRRRLSALPPPVQQQAAKAYRLWQEEPYHPSLQFKRVSQKQPIYSVRVSLNYRVLGLLEFDHIYWYWSIGIGLAHMMSTMSCLSEYSFEQPEDAALQTCKSGFTKVSGASKQLCKTIIRHAKFRKLNR